MKNSRSRPSSYRTRSKILSFSILLIFLSHIPAIESSTLNNDMSLPVLGDHISGVISPSKEYQLGQILIRQLRGQVPLISDPLSNDYLQTLSYRLASKSQLADKRLQTLIVNDNGINAFAMPGGIVAVNAGLFLNAETESEFSAVLTHELAHLSQRHFARMLAQQKNAQLTTIGAYLASFIIMATVGAEPGLGALAATQAGSIQQQLRFSRKNEQEADRVAMQTMVNAGMDPNAVAGFFWSLQKSTQSGTASIPEYLLTHPVTESRIADAQSRARAYPKRTFPNSFEYALIKTRLRALGSEKPEDLILLYQTAIAAEDSNQANIKRYGLALSQMRSKQFKEAKRSIRTLLKADPDRIAYMLTDAEIDFYQEDFKAAQKRLQKAIKIHPNNYPISLLLAESHIRLREHQLANEVLEEMAINDPENPYIWRLLVESYGISGDTLNVHRARAEHFYLYGLSEQAITQLNYALVLAGDKYQLRSKILHRIDQIRLSQEEIEL